ncbi:MAG: DUF4112 domain-containing protein [Roseicyclus sp.]
MPSTSSPAVSRPDAASPDLARRLARLDRLADQLDARFKLFGIRFGWDGILGLIPGIGDLATTLPGVYIIAEAARMGARRHVLARMGLNTAADFVVGGVPLVGDIFDIAFKSNRRNIALLKREMARREIPVSAVGTHHHRKEVTR